MTFRTDPALRLFLVSLFLWMFGIGLYEQLIPIYARDLGASAVQLGLLFTLRHIALAAGFIIAWAVSDRLSRRTVIVASWVAATPVPLLLAAAPSYGWLVPGLLLYEATYFGFPAMQAFVAQRVPRSELASAFSMMGTVTSMGFLISPTLGGVFSDWFGIRATLLLATAFYLASTFLILRVQIEAPGGGSLSAAVPFRWEQARPLVPVLWTYAGILLVILITVPFTTPFLHEVRGMSLASIGFLGSMVGLGAVAFTPVAGRLGDRLGLAPAMAATLVLFALGMVLTIYGPVALLPIVATFRCRSPLNSLGHALVGERAPPEIIGRAFALAGILAALLAAAGSFLGGFAYRVDPALPLLVSVVLAVAIAAGLVARGRAAARTPGA